MDRSHRRQSINFFRSRLIRLTNGEQIAKFLSRYERDAKAIRDEIVQIMWYSRGSLSREEAWTLSQTERNDWVELADQRMKIVKETKLPLV